LEWEYKAAVAPADKFGVFEMKAFPAAGKCNIVHRLRNKTHTLNGFSIFEPAIFLLPYHTM